MVGVTHNADIFILRGKQLRKNVLRNIRVLILVNQNVAETLLIFLQNFGISFEKLNGFKNQVVEIQRVILPQFFLIKLVNHRNTCLVNFAAERNFFTELFRRHQIIFQVGNFDIDSIKKTFAEIQFSNATLD